MRGCLRGLDGAGRRGSRIYRGRVEMGRVVFGARSILGRIVCVVEDVGARRRAVVLMVARLAVVMVEGIVGHAPQSTVIFSVSELHCGPSIGQARLRDGDVRSRATMQAAGGCLGAGSWMSWPAT